MTDTISDALVRAAHALAPSGPTSAPERQGTSSRGATLAELAQQAQVGHATARNLVPKLKSRGQLVIVGERRVPYRNRPVAEYAPAPPPSEAAQTPAIEHRAGAGWVDLGRCVAGWAR